MNDVYTSIGKFAGTYGLKGQLVLKHALGKRTALQGVKAVFTKDKTGNMFPWFVEEAIAKNDTEIYIKLESLQDKESAGKLTNKEVWLTEPDFKKFAAKNTFINLLGYTILDKNKPLGTIEEIIQQPQQILCKIMMDEKEVYIPLHEETLQKIDHKNKKVFTNLPEGLLDIYLT